MEIGDQAMQLIEKLSFQRISGTTGEHQAARILLNELERIGLRGWLEPFPVRCGHVVKATLETLPDGTAIACTGYELSASVEALEGELLYVEQLQPALLAQAKGKIVLMDGKLTNANYHQLVEAGAIGFITYMGKFWDQFSIQDFNQPRLKDLQLSMQGIPGIQIHARDAISLISSGCKRVRISLDLCESPGQSHNVVAEILGTEHPEEVIAFTAHYDTVGNSIGPYDNASGSAMMFELARIFAAYPGKRTMRFIWCGSEEAGLEGARAYVNHHANELDSIQLVINGDLLGSVMGSDYVIAMADDLLLEYLRKLTETEHFPAIVTRHAMPSDCTVFADAGVPAVGFGRYGTPETAGMHDCNDQIVFLSAAAMERTIIFAYRFCREMSDCETLPFSRTIPEELKRMIDQYLYNDFRKKLKREKKMPY